MERVLHRMAVSALVCAAPAVVSAGTVCGGSTFSTCASAHITKTLVGNGNVRVRVEAQMYVAGLGEGRSGGPFTGVGTFREADDSNYVNVAVDATARRIDVLLASRNADDDKNDDEAKPKKKSSTNIAEAKEVRAHSKVRAGFPFSRRVFEFDLLGAGAFEEFETRDEKDDAKPEKAEKEEAKRAECKSDDRALCEAVLTPEPSSLVLLVTALAGLTAFGLRRRPR